MSPRERAILTAVIEAYISTGEPVGSQTLARQQEQSQSAKKLSAATIRNVMADLAEAGMLEQPHTSAGRIPTARAFRYYVEQLSGRARIAPANLPQQSRSHIDDSFAGITSAPEFLERTSHVLALLSSGVGVAIAAAPGSDALEHVHFSRLATAKVLAVVVTKSGLVRDRVLFLDRDLSLSELETATQYLNGNFHGWSMERIRTEIARRMEQERSEYARVMDSVEQLWRKAIVESAAAGQTVYIEGVSNLIASEADREQLRQMMSALEEKQRLVELLNAYVDARQESVRVVFDLEEYAPEMRNLVLIAAPAKLAGEGRGAMGVIGPTRMHYENTMNAVSYIADLFDRMLQPPQ
ncbi:MAG: heat-inducible transcriptional repressor HrcA [Acidobacteriaceae bacterium]